jgi:hypothetical protein
MAFAPGARQKRPRDACGSPLNPPPGLRNSAGGIGHHPVARASAKKDAYVTLEPAAEVSTCGQSKMYSGGIEWHLSRT